MDYQHTKTEFDRLALAVAKDRGWPQESGAKIMGRLRLETVTTVAQARDLYTAANDFLARSLARSNDLPLSSEPLALRFTTDPGNAVDPTPAAILPDFAEAKGPEVVIPMNPDGRFSFGDFGFKAAAIVLMAHEGRPGHELHFARASGSFRDKTFVRPRQRPDRGLGYVL